MTVVKPTIIKGFPCLNMEKHLTGMDHEMNALDEVGELSGKQLIQRSVQHGSK
jgi:hypothetical protein